MIKNPISRKGEVSYSSKGQKMTIIEYRNANSIDVQFDDKHKTIVYNKTYRRFLSGNISNPNLHLGETSISSRGEIMEIVVYRRSSDIDVMFNGDKNAIAKNKAYSSFLSGHIKKPLGQHIGLTRRANNGQLMKIIQFRNRNDIDIEFEDGTIVYKKAYSNFLQGHIRNPSFSCYKTRKRGVHRIP